LSAPAEIPATAQSDSALRYRADRCDESASDNVAQRALFAPADGPQQRIYNWEKKIVMDAVAGSKLNHPILAVVAFEHRACARPGED